MRIVVQRSGPARCEVDGKVTGSIPRCLVLLVSVDPEDTSADIDWLGNKIAGLRIFPDDEDKMNRSLLDIQAEWANASPPDPATRPGALSISQFTLHASVRKGFRPSFTEAAGPVKGEEFYRLLNEDLRSRGLRVEEGIFGAMMDIHLVNEGPVTIIIDSKNKL
jgi:D-tyrosyl-tRNA(Tyr) deacylase